MTIPASGIPEARARHERFRSPLVMGSADGLVLAIGFVASYAAQPHALVKAAVEAGTAELIGMSAAAFLSNRKAGLLPALANGAGALAACALPALPYLILRGPAALVTALWLVLIVAGFIAYLRPERGVTAVLQTYGVLVGAALLCWAVSLVL